MADRLDRRTRVLVVLLFALPFVKYVQMRADLGPEWFNVYVMHGVLSVGVTGWCLTTMTTPRLGSLAQIFGVLPLPSAPRERWQLAGWTLLPGAGLVAIAAVVIAVGLRDFTTFKDGQLTELIVCTAIGEEVLFRTLLPVASLRTALENRWWIGTALGFGLWHIPDEIVGGINPTTIRNAAVVFLVTAGLAVFPLRWVRLRCRNPIGSILVHLAGNGSLLVLGGATLVAY